MDRNPQEVSQVDRNHREVSQVDHNPQEVSREDRNPQEVNQVDRNPQEVNQVDRNPQEVNQVEGHPGDRSRRHPVGRGPLEDTRHPALQSTRGDPCSSPRRDCQGAGGPSRFVLIVGRNPACLALRGGRRPKLADADLHGNRAFFEVRCWTASAPLERQFLWRMPDPDRP